MLLVARCWQRPQQVCTVHIYVSWGYKLISTSPTMNYNCIELYHHKIMLINVALHVLIYRYWPKAIHSAVDYWTYQSTKVHLILISQQFIKFINIFQDSSWRIIPISTVSSWQPPFVSHVGLIGRAPITHPFSASDRQASKVTWQKL